MRPAARAGALTFAITATLYLATAARTPGTGDVAKFQFAGPMLATPHPTGYPLYLLLTRALAAPFPPRLWPALLDASSALLVAAALAVAAASAVESAGAPVGPAVATAVAIGLLPPYWRAARVAEVIPLHLLFSSVVLALALAAVRRDGARAERAGWALWGLSFAHHATTVLLAPALVAMRLATPRENRRSLAPALVALALGGALAASLAVVLVARTWQSSPFYLEARADTLGDLLSVLRGARFQSWWFRDGWTGVARHAAAIGRVDASLAPLAVAAVCGASRLTRPQRWGIGLFAASGIAFTLGYEVPDAADYLLAPLLGLAIPAALAVARAESAIAPRGRLLQRAAIALAGVALAAEAAASSRALDRAGERREAEAREERFAALAANSLVVSFDYGDCMALELDRAIRPERRPARTLCLHPAAAASAHGLDPLLRYLAGEGLRLPPDDATLPPGRPVRLAFPERAPLADLAARGIAVAPAEGGALSLALAPGRVTPPRARLVHRRIAAASPEALGAALADAGDDQTVVLGGASAERPTSASDRLRALAETDGRLAFEVETAAGAWLVVHERWFGRWRFALDGRRVAAFAADGQFLGFEIPAGGHRLELERDLRPFSLARFLTLEPGRRGMP